MNPLGKINLTLVLRSKSNVLRFCKRIPRENICLVCIWQHLGTNSPKFPKMLNVHLRVKCRFLNLQWYFRIQTQVLKRQTFLNTPKRTKYQKCSFLMLGRAFCTYIEICVCVLMMKFPWCCENPSWRGIGRLSSSVSHSDQNLHIYTIVPVAGAQVHHWTYGL